MLAMHVAATNPVAMDIAGVPAETLARESAILEEKNAGKPANVLEKIVASGLKTYAKENTLLEQAYVHDGTKSVTQALGEAGKKAGAPVKLIGFVRMQLGEGIEKAGRRFRRRSRQGRRPGLILQPTDDLERAGAIRPFCLLCVWRPQCTFIDLISLASPGTIAGTFDQRRFKLLKPG